jgi:hypothetical protein
VQNLYSHACLITWATAHSVVVRAPRRRGVKPDRHHDGGASNPIVSSISTEANRAPSFNSSRHSQRPSSARLTLPARGSSRPMDKKSEEGESEEGASQGVRSGSRSPAEPGLELPPALQPLFESLLRQGDTRAPPRRGALPRDEGRSGRQDASQGARAPRAAAQRRAHGARLLERGAR